MMMAMRFTLVHQAIASILALMQAIITAQEATAFHRQGARPIGGLASFGAAKAEGQ
jgi:hypothetical protein